MRIDIGLPEGNAYSILRVVQKLLRDTGQNDKIDEVMTRMKSGDYDNLCAVATEVSRGSITFYNSNEDAQ